jgi:hypothetical protein
MRAQGYVTLHTINITDFGGSCKPGISKLRAFNAKLCDAAATAPHQLCHLPCLPADKIESIVRKSIAHVKKIHAAKHPESSSGRRLLTSKVSIDFDKGG